MADLPTPPPATDAHVLPEGISLRRDRLLAALTLTAGAGLLVGLPFALKLGAEFFMPTTLALIPLLEWLERRRIPSPLAALLCVILFLIAANIALAAIVVPATEFFRLLPSRINRIQANLAPLLDLYSNLERYANRTLRQVADTPIRPSPSTTTAAPGSIIELAATSAPAVIVQTLYAVLVSFFFLSGWTRMRRQMITGRASFGGAMATARVLQEMVDDVSSYLGTITFINLTLGLLVSGALWMLDMPFPLMWGGIVALLNYIPYFGPVIAALLLAVGGLMTFSDVWTALTPPAIMYGLHLVEANAITPLVVGRRLTINPVLILVSLSFWGWVWGTVGALLAVPILIIVQTIMAAAGRPDIAGFLFEHGTLSRDTPASPPLGAPSSTNVTGAG